MLQVGSTPDTSPSESDSSHSSPSSGYATSEPQKVDSQRPASDESSKASTPKPTTESTTRYHPPVDRELIDQWVRKFHDQTAQYLTALILGLRSLREDCAQLPSSLKKVVALETMAQQMSSEMYKVISALRMPEGDVDFSAEIERLSGVWAATGVAHVRTRLIQMEHLQLPPEMRDAVLGVVKEAVTNAVRYSGVNIVQIRASLCGLRLRVVVRDRGKGFLSTERTGKVLTQGSAGRGHGLIGMREHAAAVGARLRIRSSPGEGTTVLLDVSTGEHK